MFDQVRYVDWVCCPHDALFMFCREIQMKHYNCLY